MILHQLQVAHWRSLVDPVTIGPFDQGITVIHAPNGTGKSSLFEALQLALFDSHAVGGQEILTIRPWGRPLNPKVSVDFSHNDTRYLVEKTFIDSPSALLSRWEDGKFIRLAEGREADAELRALLGSSAPGRGLSNSVHWGLSQVLWSPQGLLALKELAPSVSENIRASLGVQISGDGGGKIGALIRESFLTYHTDQGKIIKGKNAPAIVSLEDELTRFSRQNQLLQTKYEEHIVASRTVEDARHLRAQKRREAEAIGIALETTQEEVERHQRLTSELQAHQEKLLLANERASAVARILAQIQAAQTDLTSFSTTIVSSENRLAELDKEKNATQLRLDHARQQRDFARTAAEGLHAEERHIEEARSYLSFYEESAVLKNRLVRLRDTDTLLQQAKIRRAALLAPEAREIAALRKLTSTIAETTAALQASQIHLTLEPTAAINVIQLPGTTPLPIASNQKHTFSASPEVLLDVPGFGRISAIGPVSNASQLAGQLRSATEKLTSLTRAYPSQDPDQLQLLRDQAAALDSEVQALDARLLTALDGQTFAVLDRQLATATAALQAIAAQHPGWTQSPPQLSQLQLALDRQRASHQQTLREAEKAWDQAQNAHLASDRQHLETANALKNNQLNLASAQTRLADLFRDAVSSDDLEKRQITHLREAREAELLGKDCTERLQQLPPNPTAQLVILRKQKETLAAAEATARDRETEAETRLQILTQEGSYSRWVEAAEQLALLTERIARERLQIDAIRLLHETWQQCKTEAIAAVAAPVEKAASQLLARIAGPRIGRVRLTENFLPTGTSPSLATDPVHFDNLSMGEQEQLFLVTRLALAQVLAKKERQLVVLDDVLTATDTARLARILGLLEELTDRLQIVVLTCHPERFGGLAQATFHELRPS